jgi:hypothetical protein
MAVRQVDDRQAPVREADVMPVVHPDPVIVGPPVGD